MVKRLFLRWFVPAALCAASLAAQTNASAQPSPQGARANLPDPLDAKASVPAPVYRSSFAPVTSAGQDKPVPWREANGVVTAIGGWRAYAREVQQPASAPAAPR
jgi:hypothetical protein